ncbi:MAG: cohesin domain-containing protein [Acidobacteriota bacterium]
MPFPKLPLLSLMLSLLLVACGPPKALKQAEQERSLGNWDTAIAYYQKVLQQDPGNLEARIELQHTKVKASQAHQKEAARLRQAGKLEAALMEYELAVRLDAANETAISELHQVQAELVTKRQAEKEGKTPIELAQERAQLARPPVPQLAPQVSGLISLDFRQVPVTEIYRTLARIGGINVLFDPDLSDEETSFRVDDVTFAQALAMLTAANNNYAKALSANTLLVAPDNPTKRRQYADQVLRTFYLSNADSATIAQMLRALLSARLVAENDELNSVTIRDTPEVVKIAERIIDANDKPAGEVLLDIEILEINRQVMEEYGLSLSDYSFIGSIAQTPAGISLEDLSNLSNEDIFVTIPSVRYQFFKEHSNFKLIAQPQLRATEGEETSLLIGERVPVINTTFNPQATTGGDVIPISSTTYVDVGITITGEPRVHHDGQVTLDLTIEVSAIIGTSSIQNLPIFSSRRLEASIRLRDGETNLLAGLLRDDERIKKTGIPGLMDIPGLGRIFSSTQEEVVKTDVLLSITPHILRRAEITDDDLRAIYVGTEAKISGSTVGPSRAVSPPRGLPGTQAAAVLAVTPSEEVVSVGEEFDLDVTVEGAADAFSAGLRLSFDPSVIEYVDAFEGDFLDQDGAETSFQASQAGAGSLAVGLARLGDAAGGITGAGSLVTLVFRAVGAGTTDVEITSAAIRNAGGRPLAVQMLPATVEVEEQGGGR